MFLQASLQDASDQQQKAEQHLSTEDKAGEDLQSVVWVRPPDSWIEGLRVYHLSCCVCI